MIEYIVEKLGLGDYLLVIDKSSEYNTTGEIELHTLNSETWVAKRFVPTLKYILDYKYSR